MSAVVIGALGATALAQPTTMPNAAPKPAASAKPGKAPPLPPAVLPTVGTPLDLTGTPSWPKLDWLYDVPAPNDAAGKVVIHWFCAPRVQVCPDDLARVVTVTQMLLGLTALGLVAKVLWGAVELAVRRRDAGDPPPR